jgi:hemerythrin-like metal-binding protein
MLITEWLKSYEIGIPSIDAQHKNLLVAFDRIQDAFHDGDHQGCRNLIFDFSRQLEAHLDSEEAYLRRIGHVDATRHAEQHKAVAQRIHSVRDACGQPMDPPALDRLLDEIGAALINDMICEDLHLKCTPGPTWAARD